MGTEAIAMLMAGIFGGFGHCVGMCGPVVSSLCLGETRRGIVHLLLYNLGRIMTYAMLGALVGFTGSFIGLTSSIAAVQTAVMALSGLFIMLMGLASAGWLPFGKELVSCAPAMPLIRKALSLFSGPGSVGAWFPMGVALGLLPCGLVYTALLTAARAAMKAPDHFAGMATGGLLMLIFGIGTAPALLLVGKAAGLFGETTRRRFYRLASIVMIGTGAWFMVGAVRM
ncbi:MAG: sulfite exporter TauE/SafE family protein [Chlorobiaceae bacterium]|nr:sulfite exporter TauE/SafE family protein [Chlorobiaceae bacterium]